MRRISSGSHWEELAGYSRAVVDPPYVFVSGTTGYDYATGAISADPAEQARQCFRNIAWALEQAGTSLERLVRVRVFVTSREVFQAVAPIVGEHCQAARPANTTVVCELVAPEMLVEIEVTAKLR